MSRADCDDLVGAAADRPAGPQIGDPGPARMPPVRRQIGQRPQDEGPALHPGMRQGRPARPPGGDFSMEIKQIEVDQAGGVGHGPDPPEGLLDLVQTRQQRVRRQVGRDLGHGVDVPGLVSRPARAPSGTRARPAGRRRPRRPSSSSAASRRAAEAHRWGARGLPRAR